MTSARPKLAVLVSGRGRNLRAMVEHGLPVTLVLADRAAPAWEYARKQGLPTCLLAPAAFADRAAFDRAVGVMLDAYGIGLAALAGFMRVLGPELVSAWYGRMLNIHPSLLPAYRGLRTHQRALEAGERRHGCTVHWVSEQLDAGPIIQQSAVPVLEDDGPAELARRVGRAERRLYPRVIEQALLGRIPQP